MNTHLNLSDALGDSIPENEALSIIKSESEAYERFQSFAPNDRKNILEFIQGQRGLKITYDSGAEVTTLWHTMYVSLDTFHKVVQNIDGRLHAWLTFLSSDEPADIINLLTLYPEFRELYQEIAEFRTNPKELIYMYSEALAIMDRNAIQLTLEAELSETREELNDTKEQLSDAKEQIAEKDDIIAKQLAELARYKALYGEHNTID